MKNKIEFTLKKSDKKLIFKIIKQVGFTSIFQILEQGYIIKCERILYPAIYIENNLFKKEIHICLRGSDTIRDKTPFPIIFKSNEERDKVYDLIIIFFKKISHASMATSKII